MAYDPWSRVLLFRIVETEVGIISHTPILHLALRRHFPGSFPSISFICFPDDSGFSGDTVLSSPTAQTSSLEISIISASKES